MGGRWKGRRWWTFVFGTFLWLLCLSKYIYIYGISYIDITLEEIINIYILIEYMYILIEGELCINKYMYNYIFDIIIYNIWKVKRLTFVFGTFLCV